MAVRDVTFSLCEAKYVWPIGRTQKLSKKKNILRTPFLNINDNDGFNNSFVNVSNFVFYIFFKTREQNKNKSSIRLVLIFLKHYNNKR